MPVTMMPREPVQGLGPALQIAEGWTVDLPGKVHETLDERTNPTWPTTWFARARPAGPLPRRLHGDEQLGRQPRRHRLRSLSAPTSSAWPAMLRIPVYMHNVGEEAIFRPSAWTLFGANEPMGADFRACANFGSLYG
jgi:L-fucose isomerase